MIELYVLGPIDLVGPDARVREALMAHPKRLAVLAYLLLGGGDARMSRKSVIEVFWPDSPPDRARGSLRNAVHFLRKQLGSDAIRSRGDELAIDTRRVWCDAHAFQRQLEEGREREALALYRGRVLSGIADVDAPSFGRWLDELRVDFDRRAAAVAWTVAERDEGRRNWISAVDAARRAVALSGRDERSVRRLMRLLERAGDRVAALRTYDQSARRWRARHGIEASEETRHLAEGIRARSAGVGGGARVSGELGPAPSDRRVGPSRWDREPTRRLAVLPFLRSGSDSGMDAVSSGLATGLISSLSRLSDVRVVARTSVERYGEQGSSDDVLPIAQALGVDTVLQGSIGSSQGRLVVAVQLVDARSGAPTWAEIYEWESDNLLSIQVDLADRVVDELGLRVSAEERARLLTKPTESPAAYQEFLEGRLALRRRSKEGLERAAASFERALELDPKFALAYAGLADTYMLLWPIAGVRSREARVRAREAAQAALRLDDGLGEAHATLAILRGALEGDWYGAEADFRRAIELSPGYATAHQWYGAYLTNILRRFDDADAELALARELDPLSPVILVDSGMTLFNRGSPAEAIRLLEKALALAPEWWRAHYDLGLALAVAGDMERAVDHLERAWAAGAYGAEASPAPSLVSAHSPSWRARLEEKLRALDAAPPGRQSKVLDAAVVAMLLGERDEALARLASADRSVLALVMAYLPVFRPLWDDPGFNDLLENAGLRRIEDRPGARPAGRGGPPG